MEIMLRHIDVCMTDNALDGGEIHAQSLKLTDIGMSTTVGSQNANSFNFAYGSLELVPEVGWVTRLIFLPASQTKVRLVVRSWIAHQRKLGGMGTSR